MRRTFPWAVVVTVTATTAWLVAAAITPRVPQAAGIEILGGPVNLAAEGDTLTICGVARMSDGSYHLGHLALLLRADTDSTIVGVPSGVDVRERCAPLLRNRGLPLDLPLTDIDWRQTQGVAVRPETVT